MKIQLNEDALVEKPAIEILEGLGYEHKNCFHEGSSLERSEINEVVLVSRLKPALQKLNPEIPEIAIDQAITELTLNRSHQSLEVANREVYKLIKDGVPVVIPMEDGSEERERVKVVDFDNPENNDFFLASQFWIAGEMYKRRTDLLGFVNGLPLIFIELKASHKNLKHAFDENLRDYKTTIPQLFWYNAFVVLSNGLESKIGSISSGWEHFYDWKKINSEGEEGIVSMETILRGTCEKTHFLDLLENFILFDEGKGGIIKIIARNHQFLGVNNAVENFAVTRKITDLNEKGKVGVFWHTQGSGKSFSMVFFAQKILRKFHGNFTFLVVTDRKELDKQIYKQFISSGVVTEEETQADSSESLKRLLKEDHRMIFTLIQKFRSDDTGKFPKLSEREDIIVMTDEAHRSQYETLALNMRMALPNAAFIGFTGTPLIAGEDEKTREVFGDYVSVYNFRQSIEDKATVPLYYENRIPELQLTNDDLDGDLQKIIEEADLDEAQNKKLESEFARQYHLITRDDRLETVTGDIVRHFLGREGNGKAMVISIDKTTAVRTYDKFISHLKEYEKELLSLPQTPQNKEKIEAIKKLDVAVVVSEAQNEIADFKEKGLEIETHRRRIKNEDLEKKFKDKDDPLRVVFVCNMWLTGFDVPSLSTMYLDKPMKNHSLMQAIARANRVFPGKSSGLIVDYIGVFRNLQKALSIYAADHSGLGLDPPIQSKEELLKELEIALAEVEKYSESIGIRLESVINAENQLLRLKAIGDAVDAILQNEETKKRFKALSNNLFTIFKAILPDPLASKYQEKIYILKNFNNRITDLEEPADITQVTDAIEELLDESVATDGYRIEKDFLRVDLSKIDFEALKKHFESNRKNIVTEALKGKIEDKLEKMIQLNPERITFMEKFKNLLKEYNAGTLNQEVFFDKLMAFVQELNEEEKRAVKEELNEEELALFDILKKEELSTKEKKEVKKVAQDLLTKLKWAKLIRDWKRTQRGRATVLITVRDTLDDKLPRSYSPNEYEEKCDAVYRHIYDSYEGNRKSVYELTA